MKVSEIRPYVAGEDPKTAKVSISAEYLAAGSPKESDMISRNPDNHADH